jgi:phosphoribosyl 1,2-cyclic phosphodiesterase
MIRGHSKPTPRDPAPVSPQESASPVHVVVLGSGSSGNCTALVMGDRIVLVDCGFSPLQTRKRMALCGLDPTRVAGIVLTHPDSDHLNAGWTRALGGLTGPMLHVAKRHAHSVRYSGVNASAIVAHDDEFEVAGLVFAALRMPHDSEGSCAFRIERGDVRIGYATDLGRTTPELAEHLAGCPILCLESNYCPAMQLASGRPAFLVDRIMGGRGHLSNHQALALAQSIHRTAPIQRLILLHLSRQCNAPEVVRRLYAERAPELLDRLVVTGQIVPSAPVEATAGGHARALF